MFHVQIKGSEWRYDNMFGLFYKLPLPVKLTMLWKKPLAEGTAVPDDHGEQTNNAKMVVVEGRAQQQLQNR